MFHLHDSVKKIHPNAVQYIDNIPLVVFRDHRWTLPVVSAAIDDGLLSAPATVVTFDRHRDMLEPVNGHAPLNEFRSGDGGFERLVEIVRDHCSPRDDDWICSGMELGLIGDVVHFSAGESYEDDPAAVLTYTDAAGMSHRVFQCGRPARELSWKGALVDDGGGEITDALKTVLGWDPALPGITEQPGSILLDIDLDFFTMGWQNYTLPFPDEVFNGEFLSPCQSGFYDAYAPLSFFNGLLGRAGVVSIACEPGFCGGAEKTNVILQSVNRFLFDGKLDTRKIEVEYPPDYPDE